MGSPPFQHSCIKKKREQRVTSLSSGSFLAVEVFLVLQAVPCVLDIVIVVDLEDKDPDQLMMDALDAGADDFDAGEDAAEVVTSPENFTAVCEALEKKGYTFVSAEVEMVPDTYTTLTDPDQILKMQKLIDALEDNDDVQQVWHNWDAPEEEDED